MMTGTDDLIARLSKDVPAVRPLRVGVWAPAVIAVLLLYGVGAQLCLGIRPDIALRLTMPAYVIEIMLLAALSISGVIASIHGLYPDMCQRAWVARLPLIMFAGVIIILVYEVALLHPTMDMDIFTHADGLECTLCIAMIAVIPSAILFVMLRKGAVTHPAQSGLIAALTAASIGCLVLRLGEQNDSAAHFIVWHYIPTVLFAGLGAGLGKLLLRW